MIVKIGKPKKYIEIEEYERLKKELEDNTNQWMEHSNKAFLEGERRERERVKKYLDDKLKRKGASYDIFDHRDDIRELGLGDEDKTQ